MNPCANCQTCHSGCIYYWEYQTCYKCQEAVTPDTELKTQPTPEQSKTEETPDVTPIRKVLWNRNG